MVVDFPFKDWEVFADGVGIKHRYFFSSSVLSRLLSILASSSSSSACFSSNVWSLGTQSGVLPFFSIVQSDCAFQCTHGENSAVEFDAG